MIEMRGKAVSDRIKEDIAEGLDAVIKALGRKPRLEIIRVGTNEADASYGRSAIKKAEAFGMSAGLASFPSDISCESFKEHIRRKSRDEDVDGILVLRPLPPELLEAAKRGLSPDKDLDGMTDINMSRIFQGQEGGFAPCTAMAVMRLLDFYGADTRGKHVVIIGRSPVVGKPLAMLMLSRDATVTVCHSKTGKDILREQLSSADIICTAVGKAEFLGPEYIKDGAVIVDCGINVSEEGKLCGDVDYEAVKEKCLMISPVPGGLGAVTTAVLCENLFKAARIKAGK